MLPSSPSVARNAAPIEAELAARLPAAGFVLELAAGTGEHAVRYAARFPGLTWAPTDVDEAALASIAAWRAASGVPNLLPPRRLDATAPDWAVPPVDVLLAFNLVHYVTWRAAQGLFAGAARHLAPGGILVTYGAYTVGGAHTAPSNEAFDAGLRARDPEAGVRALETMEAEAGRNGLVLRETVPMPANNFLLVFGRG